VRRGRDWKLLRKHEETWGFVLILVVVTLALYADRIMWGGVGADFDKEFIDTAFNAVSVMTTTGFVVGDYNSWPEVGKGLIVFLMLVGGCAGSTAGGLKVSRVILWMKMLRIEIRRAYRPNELVKLKLNGRPVPDGTRGQMFVIATSAAVAIALGSYLLAAMEPKLTFDGCLSAVVTCVSNVGPAFNEFGPTENFAKLSHASKIMLSLLMVVGRLEYIAVLVLFSRTLWRKY
jgi:trk system potassium uptake protein TrkH